MRTTVALAFTVFFGLPLPAAEITFRLDLRSPSPDRLFAGLDGTTATVNVDAAETILAAEIDVVIDSALESCVDAPTGCDGGENFLKTTADGVPFGYGCSDGLDNDGDTLVDLEDPDCGGIQGWSVRVHFDECFVPHEATTRGTAADFVFQGGFRDITSFERSQIDTENFFGERVALSAVALSLQNAVTLPPVGEFVVLRIALTMDLANLSLDGPALSCSAEPRTIDPACALVAQAGLRCLIGAATVAGRTLEPEVRGLDLLVRRSDGAGADFVRGDANADGRVDVADALFLLQHVLATGATVLCEKAGDSNDDGRLDLADVVSIIAYRFSEGPAPTSPFPECGSDSSDDGLVCQNSPCAGTLPEK